MKGFFTATLTGIILVLVGLLTAGIIVITNVVNGLNNGWSGEIFGWILGAVLGFVAWEFTVIITCFFAEVGFFFPGAFITFALIIAGFIVGSIIVVTNVVNGVNNGWDGTTVGWILGAVLGFIVWVPVLGISSFLITGRK
jgi:cyanate permease